MQMAQRLNGDLRLRFFIGDVRDKDRLYLAMNEVDIVLHAAAFEELRRAFTNP